MSSNNEKTIMDPRSWEIIWVSQELNAVCNIQNKETFENSYLDLEDVLFNRILKHIKNEDIDLAKISSRTFLIQGEVFYKQYLEEAIFNKSKNRFVLERLKLISATFKGNLNRFLRKSKIDDKIINEVIYQNNNSNNSPEKSKKLIWKGTPAQLAFVINLLHKKGYIDGLTLMGERNAKIVLNHFDFADHTPSHESLGKCFRDLKNDILPINKDDASKFQKIPRRDELKK